MRVRRLTIRARLTLTYAGLVTAAGGVLIAVVYAFMRFVPEYNIQAASPLRPGESPLEGTLPTQASSHSTTIAISSAGDFLETMLIIAVIALLLLAVISGWVGWVVAGRMLQPLHSINDAAVRAATGALDHRVGLTGPDDEIRALSTTFDSMLHSLERSFAAHQRFAANASHELRTPLAATQTLIDVTLARPDATPDDLRDLAGKIRQINHGNIQTVEALLDLAELDTATLRVELVTLAGVVDDVLGGLEAQMSERGITVSWDTRDAAVVPGDRVLIRQAVRNLLHNAVRHNVTGGEIGLSVRAGEDTVTLWVMNTGPVVDDDTVEMLREPLVRGAGRVASVERGHGLGLAISSSIAEAHEGALHLFSRAQGGLRVGLELPK